MKKDKIGGWIAGVTGVFLILSLFTGPFFCQPFALYKMGTYKTLAYGQTASMTYPKYNFMYGEYSVTLMNESGQRRGQITYNLFKNLMVDSLKIDLMDSRLNDDLSRVQKKLPLTVKIGQGDCYTMVDVKNQEIIYKHKLYLLNVLGTDANITVADSEKRPSDIFKIVVDELGSDYDIVGVQLSYQDKNGIYGLRKE